MLFSAGRGLAGRVSCARVLMLLRGAKEVSRDYAAYGVATSFPRRSSSQTQDDGEGIATTGSASSSRGNVEVTNGDQDRRRPVNSSSSKRGVRRKLPVALGLKEFMHRQRVLEVYRGILKRARELEDKDVATEAKRQFRISKHETDPLKVKMLLADAVNYLEAMQGSLRGGGVTANGAGSWLEIDDPEDERGRVGAGFPWERS